MMALSIEPESTLFLSVFTSMSSSGSRATVSEEGFKRGSK